MRPADRIAKLKPYFFAQLNSHLLELRNRGVDVIRLDVGSPDQPPPDFVLQRMVDRTLSPDAHGYQPYGGKEIFREAVAAYYKRRFGVSLDPKEECEGLLGSKEGIFNLSQAVLNPGDLALIPEPAYPTYAWGAEVAGADIYQMPLVAENEFLPDLKTIPESVLRRAKLMWLNYPNNPTGAVADLDYFEGIVAIAREYSILVLHDAPYLEIVYDGYQAPSILQVPGALNNVVEFNSLSKTYNMAGWRLGMAVGNREVIGHLHALKTKVDSSHFGPSQEAGALALTGDQSWLASRNLLYQERRDLIVNVLDSLGFEVHPPKAALYIWARIPGEVDDGAYCRRLVDDTGISITPGTVFGESGAGYVRLSLCTQTPRVKEALERIVQWAGEKH